MKLKQDLESRIDRMMRRCVHFNGFQNKTCDVGIKYETFGNEGQAVPCCFRYMEKREQGNCDKRQLYTRQEAEQHFANADAAFERTIIARKAIVAHIEATKQQGGTIMCPVCNGGTLAYVRHSNGHIHAQCGTDGCVGWME